MKIMPLGVMQVKIGYIGEMLTSQNYTLCRRDLFTFYNFVECILKKSYWRDCDRERVKNLSLRFIYNFTWTRTID